MNEVPEIAPRGHILLVSPPMFSYHLAIAQAMKSLGYRVTWWDERASSSTGYKFALRLFPALIRRWSERRFLSKLAAMSHEAITDVLVVKGEGLTAEVVQRMRKVWPDASCGLYLWDSADNVPGISRLMSEFDAVSTFDPEDAKAKGWTYRPLFARKLKAKVVSGTYPPASYDWSFIGTVHSDRHRVIHRLRSQPGSTGTCFVFAYFQSPLILWARKLTDWTLWLAPRGTLSTRPMSAEDVALVAQQSRSVLDIEHPRQRGFTMRTIETLLAGKKLVTTNAHIQDSDLYHPSRVLVIRRAEPNLPAAFVDAPFVPLPDALQHKYSCEGWVEELLALQRSARSDPASFGLAPP